MQPNDPHPSNPFSSAPQNPFQPVAPLGMPGMSPPAPATSTLAVTSMILGAISPLLYCACYMSLLSSVAAIVCGHLALRNVRRSAGTLTGRGLAVTGLVFGYVMFLATATSVGVFVAAIARGVHDAQRQAADGTSTSLTAEARLHEVELSIQTKGGGVAQGNSAAAIELAREFSENMKTLREEFFTKKKKPGFSLSGGEFITHCEWNADGSVAFLVHVPSYRKFTADAKKSLAELAWLVAQQVVEGELEPGAPLAVGMRGTLLYGSVMVGKVGAEEPDSSEDNREKLLPFFRPRGDEPEMDDGLIKLDPAEPNRESTEKRDE